MTALTPQQMRELADAAGNLTRDNDWDNETIVDVIAALRTVADRLEEMHDVLPLAIDKLGRAGYHSSAKQLQYLLAAGIEPSERLDD